MFKTLVNQVKKNLTILVQDNIFFTNTTCIYSFTWLDSLAGAGFVDTTYKLGYSWECPGVAGGVAV